MQRILLLANCVLFGFASMAQADRYVFSTNSKWSPNAMTYGGMAYKVEKKQKCKDELKLPEECYWIVRFGSSDLPMLRLSDEPLKYTVEDLNMDGTRELIVMTPGMGTAWAKLHVFTMGDPSMTSGPFWYEPFEAFDWYAGFDGDRVCDAQVFWNAKTSAVRILTTDHAQEDFRCTLETTQKWVVQ